MHKSLPGKIREERAIHKIPTMPKTLMLDNERRTEELSQEREWIRRLLGNLGGKGFPGRPHIGREDGLDESESEGIVDEDDSDGRQKREEAE